MDKIILYIISNGVARQREGERQTETERDRESERDRERQRERERDRQTDRDGDRDRLRNGSTDLNKDRPVTLSYTKSVHRFCGSDSQRQY